MRKYFADSMGLEAKCEKYSQTKVDIEKIGRYDDLKLTMHDPGCKYFSGFFGETDDFSFTSVKDIELSKAGEVFFWLHVPSGGLFAAVFTYVSLRALWEMWFNAMPVARRR